ncbi:GNAT family N-acetyltransferase [Priestia aryabhattai]|uniref:GNAT family N-acetyltransferase n=1 Tax=Priestia aryabhattai TaxID=412384 RepID=UPI001FB3179C|nr:hypothetical protein [Priestia aryabhattai]
MVINQQIYHVKGLQYIIRSAHIRDANELSHLRVQLDGETENLDRESGEGYMTLNVLETNKKAIDLYEKFGFEVEGVLKNDKVLSDGKFYNTVVMGRFA